MFCCLAGTSHRVAGSCLAFWVKRSRAGGVREGHSGNRSLSSPTAGRDASLTLALFFPPPPSSFLLPTHSCKSLFLWLTLFFFSAPCFFLFLHSFTSCFFFFFLRLTLRAFSLSLPFSLKSLSHAHAHAISLFSLPSFLLFLFGLSLFCLSPFSLNLPPSITSLDFLPGPKDKFALVHRSKDLISSSVCFHASL